MTKPPGGKLAVHPLPYNPSPTHWFRRLRSLPCPVLLASGDSTHPAARYDILSAAPRLLLRSHGGNTSVTDTASGRETRFGGDSFAVLAGHCPVDAEPVPELPFTGGALGYFGYELLHAGNHLPRTGNEAIPLPDMQVGIHDWALVVDHKLQRSTLVGHGIEAKTWRELLLLFEGKASIPDNSGFRLTSPFVSNFSREEYLRRFQRVIDYIHAGDCYQVNLAQCFSATCSGDSLTAFEKLQARARAPFAAYLENGDQAVLSFSPERFIRVRERQVLTQPIKGTRPRAADPARDLANRIDLETSRKDRAENLMIVDLLRNDLGRVCETGSVSTENLFETQSFTNVHHLVSTIKGRLARAEDVFSLLAASFPGGSITGTPKLRAMQIISELETRPRSVYCGAIGYIDRSGNMDSNICIRTLVRHGDRIHCWGGGGLVADSVGEQEYQETLDKIAMFIEGLGQL